MSRRNPYAKRRPPVHAEPRYQVEILLPVFYNDGREIEFEKFAATATELFAKFGGLRETPAENPPPFAGLWQDSGQVYSDRLRTLLIETTCDRRLFRWLYGYKRKLEGRFEQVEIYITVTEILRVL